MKVAVDRLSGLSSVAVCITFLTRTYGTSPASAITHGATIKQEAMNAFKDIDNRVVALSRGIAVLGDDIEWEIGAVTTESVAAWLKIAGS